MSAAGRKAVLLPLAPRTISPGVLAMVAGAVLASFSPTTFVVVGGTGQGPGRLVGVFEGVPMVVAVILVQGLAPRLPQWDRYGAVKTRHTALALATAATVVSCGYFFALLQLYPDWGDPPAAVLRPVVNNVAVAALVAVIFVGTLGRLAGVLAWAATLYAIAWAPLQWTSLGPLLPLNLTLGSPEGFDLSIRWGWLLALTALAGVTAWRRRMVPLEWTIRPPEERQ